MTSTLDSASDLPGAPDTGGDRAAEIERFLGPRLRLDTTTRGAYTSDASLYRRFPAAVLEPRDTDDVRAGVELARLRGWSVVGRGGGTSVAGNAIGEGLVIDTSRRMNRVLEIDPVARTARVQPGVVCDQLKEAAAAHGLTYGPDPSTHSRCTIGGMVANNACGSHSVAWGTSASNLVSITTLLADGREVRSDHGGADDEGIDAALRGLRDRHLAMLRLELGRFPRQVSGYGLHYLLPENGFDVAKAVAGSEGTLGVITELTVSLVELPKATALAVLAFPTVFDAAAAAPRLRQEGVATIEGMGGDLLAALRSQPGKERAGSGLPGGAPGDVTAGGWLYCETTGATLAEAEERARGLVAGSGPLVASTVVTDRAQTRALWRIREAGAGIVTRLPDGGEAWPGWEDSAVPAENLADYLRDLYELLDSHGLRGIPFGHFGEGCVHIRVSYPLRDEGGDRVFRAFMESAAALVASHGGSLSGEHGDGRARSEFLARMYSPEMLAAFRSFKEVFDPDGLFNPGVLVDPDPVDRGLRPGPEQRRFELTPVHALSRDEGSLVNAVNRCVGVGSCRSDEGAMCPSFQVTGDEVHSTRGRARLLSEMLRGERITGGHRSEEVREALDLCLSCKACASECPVNVDMATYKSEFLNQHYSGRLRPMTHYSMGWLPALTALMHRVPGAARALNALMRVPALERMVKAAAGVDRSRSMIRFAPRSLQTEFRRSGRAGAAPAASAAPRETGDGPDGGARPRLVLWPDSFSNHLDSGPGLAAVEVLEALGYEVLMPREFVCCGLTWHSTGQLAMVKRVLRRSVEVMEPYVEAGVPVVGLEPSCREMLAHELTELLPGDPRAERLQRSVVSFSEVVSRHLPGVDADPGDWPFGELRVGAVSQVHCHERSMGDSAPSSALLSAVGVDERAVRTGCCGLAGNWGFEPGHADLSRDLGERELFPAIRARGEGDIVLADGFSCRTQVRQETDAEPLHLAEVLRRALGRPGDA
ncbi:FAD-binding and (Fe-S)-binding domain-containing protein [Nocardiopsis sp. NPDC007018]|uniref:FAD-binding and (Fe-S)-binding domain-containing protein n=1 Tax=Nocardiopsis sp. NPDC007018 TaxID=3155721 RepID=UPI0033FBEBA7